MIVSWEEQEIHKTPKRTCRAFKSVVTCCSLLLFLQNGVYFKPLVVPKRQCSETSTFCFWSYRLPAAMAGKMEERKSTISLRNHHLATEERHTAAKGWHSDARGGVLTLSSTLKTNAFQTKRKLELFLKCTDLVLLDSFTKSDPMCVLYVKRFGQWMEYGRTESIPNCLQPKVCSFFRLEKEISY